MVRKIKIGKIKNINLALSNKCNLRCKHCDIWREKPKEDISLELINDLLNSRMLDSNLDITLTGGEPFLYGNFTELVRLIFKKSPNSLKTISTNGTLRAPLLGFLYSFHNNLPKDFALHISLDGINCHDKQRPKSLKVIKDNIDLLKKMFPYLNIKLKYTITPINYRDIISTYRYAQSNSLGFKLKLVENAVNYTNKIKKQDFYFNQKMKKSITESLAFIYKKEKLNNGKDAAFINKTIEFLLGKNKKIFCRAPFNRIFIVPDGKLYSCIHFKPIGNIKKNALDWIWTSDNATHIRDKVREEGCNKCVSYHGYDLY